MRRAGSLALFFRQPRARKLGPVAALQLQPAPCATAVATLAPQSVTNGSSCAVATLVPQSVTNGSSSKSDEAWGVSGTAAAVLAAASCGATAQAMDKDNNLQTERLDDSSLSETHSTAVPQQTRAASSPFWAERARSKAAEFVTRLGELRQRQKQVRKDAKAAGRTVTIAEVPEALKQQQAKKEETAKGYFERVYKEGQELRTLKPVTVGNTLINRYQVATADLPTDHEAEVMQNIVAKKFVVGDKLIHRRKIPSDAPALVSVEGRPCPEFLFLPKAFSHKAYCATHRVPALFRRLHSHTQAASWT